MLAGAGNRDSGGNEFGGGAAAAAGLSKNQAGLRRAKDTETQNLKDIEHGLSTMRDANT